MNAKTIAKVSKSLNISVDALKEFIAYAEELTAQVVEIAHFEANTINSRLKLRQAANNKERNILTRLENDEISNVVQRSKTTTKSDKLNHALTEYRTLHAHVKFINEQKYEYYDKRTQTFELVNVDISYLKRHIKHNCEKLKHLFTLEQNAENINQFRVIEKKDVEVFKTK